MDIATIVIEALKFVFPAYCANATPVLSKGKRPMDFGRNFFDGRRLLGANKTFRGFFFGLLIGTVVGLMEVAFFHYPWLFAIFTPLGALLGDLAGAFLKRRLNIQPGGLLPVVDQIDFVVGALVFSLPIMTISWQVAVGVLLITPPIHLFTNYLAYSLKLKKNPW